MENLLNLEQKYDATEVLTMENQILFITKNGALHNNFKRNGEGEDIHIPSDQLETVALATEIFEK